MFFTTQQTYSIGLKNISDNSKLWEFKTHVIFASLHVFRVCFLFQLWNFFFTCNCVTSGNLSRQLVVMLILFIRFVWNWPIVFGVGVVRDDVPEINRKRENNRSSSKYFNYSNYSACHTNWSQLYGLAKDVSWAQVYRVTDLKYKVLNYTRL